MSTHNIGFYEEISKIIPSLSLNIIKYALYLLFRRKWIFVSFRPDKIHTIPANLEILDIETRGTIFSIIYLATQVDQHLCCSYVHKTLSHGLAQN